MNTKLLITGAIPNVKYKLGYGGATVLMQNFLEYLNKHNISYKFIHTTRFWNSKTGKKCSLLNSVYFFFNFIVNIPFCDIVMFNFSDNGVVKVFPTLVKISKLFRKKIVLRKFGGSLDICFNECCEKQRNTTLESISKCDLILFETKAGIAHLRKNLSGPINIHWFPNNRECQLSRRNPSEINSDIVFISRISDEKGVADIVKIAQILSPEFTFHLYGNIADPKYENFDWSSNGVKFHGTIESSRVPDILAHAHLLILPSYYREGYPGIIIEALSVGVPVVATNVGGIPEMIQNNIEGKIVSPGDIEGLIAAIRAIDNNSYIQYCDNAYNRFKQDFESETINRRVLDLIIKL